MKNYVSHVPIGIAFPCPLCVSNVVVGKVLCQPIGENQRDHVVAFFSKQFIITNKNYSTTKHECFSMVFNVNFFWHYLLLNLIVFFLDHMALKYLVNTPNLNGRLVCWILLLDEFDNMMESIQEIIKSMTLYMTSFVIILDIILLKAFGCNRQVTRTRNH